MPIPAWVNTFGPSIVEGAASLFGGRAANAASAREAQRNRDFQLMMSSTAHQREVKDLRAAGLNPILSVNKGATTGSGSMAPQHDVVTPAVHSAQAGRRLAAELQLISEQAGKTAEERNNARLQGIILGPAAATAQKTMEGFQELKKVQPAVEDMIFQTTEAAIKSGQQGMQWLIDQIRRAPEALKQKAEELLSSAKEHFTADSPETRKANERQKLLDEWNALKIEYEKKKTGRRRREW